MDRKRRKVMGVFIELEEIGQHTFVLLCKCNFKVHTQNKMQMGGRLKNINKASL